jgi:hypothetical protein
MMQTVFLDKSVHTEYRLRVDVNLCCCTELELNANIFGCGNVTQPLSIFTKSKAAGTLTESGPVESSWVRLTKTPQRPKHLFCVEFCITVILLVSSRVESSRVWLNNSYAFLRFWDCLRCKHIVSLFWLEFLLKCQISCVKSSQVNFWLTMTLQGHNHLLWLELDTTVTLCV